MSVLLAVLACALFSAARPARAGVLYRCAGAQGEAVFSSSKAGYRDCRQVAAFTAPVSHAGPRRMASKEIASLAWVTGWVETSAKPISPIVVSLDRVEAGVETTAQVAPRPTGKPGQWTYSESRDSPHARHMRSLQRWPGL